MGKKIKTGDRVLLWALALLLSAGGILLTFFPAPRFSPAENRLLADLPVLTVKGLTGGTYTAALDTYATERCPLRLPLRQGNALLQLALGKRESGDVILCRDGSLARRTPTDERVWQRNLFALRALSAQGFTVAIAPRRIDARAEVLPRTYDTREDLAPWATLTATLPQSITFPALTQDAHWYRTDHHWSTAGAYEAYFLLGEALGYTPYPETDFARKTVSTSFYGTSAGASGIPFLSPDAIELWHYNGENDLCVRYDGQSGQLYDLQALHTRDGYAVFQGGNHAVTEISLGNRPTLLVIKDSFANSLLPFLARHFNIIAIDPRYGNIDPIAIPHDRALVLCGMQTLCQTAFFKA